MVTNRGSIDAFTSVIYFSHFLPLSQTQPSVVSSSLYIVWEYCIRRFVPLLSAPECNNSAQPPLLTSFPSLDKFSPWCHSEPVSSSEQIRLFSSDPEMVSSTANFTESRLRISSPGGRQRGGRLLRLTRVRVQLSKSGKLRADLRYLLCISLWLAHFIDFTLPLP